MDRSLDVRVTPYSPRLSAGLFSRIPGQRLKRSSMGEGYGGGMAPGLVLVRYLGAPQSRSPKSKSAPSATITSSDRRLEDILNIEQSSARASAPRALDVCSDHRPKR